MKPFSIIIPFSGLKPVDLASLQRGLEAWHRAGFDQPIVMVTDRETPSHDLWTVRSIRFDLGGWEAIDGEVGSAMRRSLLVCRALACFDGPLLVTSAGTIFRKDPRRSRWAEHEDLFWAVPWSITGRQVIAAPFHDVRRRDTSVMWFGGQRRAAILTAYRKALGDLRESIRAGSCFEDLHHLSDLAWSLAAHWLGAGEMHKSDCGIEAPELPKNDYGDRIETLPQRPVPPPPSHEPKEPEAAVTSKASDEPSPAPKKRRKGKGRRRRKAAAV